MRQGSEGKGNAMNMKKLAMCAAMSALPCATALAEGERTFVLWDQWLQMPAVCYRLDPGWEGKGQITWNLRGDNKYYASTILSCPKKHLYVQTAGPMLTMGGVLTPQLYAEFQDANVMAQGIAAEINRSQVFFDAAVFTFNIAGQILMSLAFMEQWVLWIVVDVVTVIMWAAHFAQGGETIATLAMWSIYLLNAIIMFVRWYREAKAA